MPVQRPTFNESWHRVADLRPRLRSTLQVVRQHYRGQLWYVVQDPANNQFFRLSRPAYYLMGLLDGRRTVAEAWEVANGKLGDDAPTQGEAIQLLGQLHAGNLLQSDLPPDSAGLFERYRKRVRREIGGYLTNILFARIPLLDPDRFLDRWVHLLGWVFSKVGLGLWAVLVVVGLYSVVSRWDEAARQAVPQSLLDWDNLLLLYLAFAGIKVIHEFGHAFACKHFGRSQHTAGQVHAMGVMFLVFMPIPYVDASSSWLLRSKWQRIAVGAAGMYLELAVAAVAAVVWSQTGSGTLVHDITYNLMFVAGVSTVLFNGNPLLRYDAYYMLSDLLEIPNLTQRSREYLYWLARRYAFGVPHLAPLPLTGAERRWLLVYGLASAVYRVFISVAILWYVADKLFLVGAAMGVAAVVGWVLMPLGRFLRYLATSPELVRVRARAVTVTVLVGGALAVGLGAIPAPEHGRAEGLVEPVAMQDVHSGADGFIRAVLDDGAQVGVEAPVLVAAENPELESRYAQALAQREALEAQLNVAWTQEVAAVLVLREQLAAQDALVRRLERERANLQLRAPIAGQWVAWDVQRLRDAYVRRSQRIGTVADLSRLIVRVAADQTLGPRIDREVGVGARVSLRAKGRPDLYARGVITRILPAGQSELWSPALAVTAGGTIPVRPDADRLLPAEPIFEIQIRPEPGAEGPVLRPGQRVVARFTLPSRPLALQGWHWFLQAIQRRFQI